MNRSRTRLWLTGSVLFACYSLSVCADEPTMRPESGDLAIYLAAPNSVDAQRTHGLLDGHVHAKPKLDQVLQLAHAGLKKLEDVNDYTCTLVRRERVNGKLMPEQTLFAKVRHEAVATTGQACFSLYMRFESPGRSVVERSYFVIQVIRMQTISNC